MFGGFLLVGLVVGWLMYPFRSEAPMAFRQSASIERDGAVAIVTINRPEVLNALNAQTLDELARRCSS